MPIIKSAIKRAKQATVRRSRNVATKKDVKSAVKAFQEKPTAKNLAAAHGQGGQAVLEGLLEAEELQDALIDRRMEAQAALVGADGAVELDAVAAVHLDLALIIDPGHTEGDDALGLDQTLDQAGLLVLGMLLHHGLDALQHLADSLQELRLIGIALCKAIVNALQVFIRQHNRILLFP